MNESSGRQSLTLGQAAALAILQEVTAPKPGNVHRGADFEDMTYDDIVAGGIAIAPAIDRADEASIGEMILDAAQRTRSLVGKNTNLGTILLIAPLAKAAVPLLQSETVRPADWRESVSEVLQSLTPDDARLTYEAIRIAQPGGLGKAEQHDVAHAPPLDLLVAMQAAAERDLVAAQYANSFEQVFEFVLPRLSTELEHHSRNDSVVRVFLQLMAEFPDSLIARKCGAEVARQSADRAAEVLQSGLPGSADYLRALAEFDFWLRSDGHRRNPGTSADLIAAGLFCGNVMENGCAG